MYQLKEVEMILVLGKSFKKYFLLKNFSEKVLFIKKFLGGVFMQPYHSQELYHHGIKGMKWGVRRYQNKDGSLTLAGKKRLRKDLQDAGVAQKYKTMKTAQNKHDSNIEKVYRDKPSDYRASKEEARKMDKSFKEASRKTSDYYDTVDKVVNNFINEHGNKRVSDVKAMSDKGQKEVNKLLEASKKDPNIWNQNIETIRRYNAYEDLKRLQDDTLNKDVNDQIDKVYKDEYGEDINSSRATKDSQKKWSKHLRTVVKNNKRNGYYR